MPARVIVIGAGFAGLACADRLVTLGHDVTVLEAFLAPDQLEDWRRFNRFVAVGGTTGHRYMITSRHARDGLAAYQRTLYDLDERRALHVQDHEVPAPEECLAFALLVQLPGRESCLRSVH